MCKKKMILGMVIVTRILQMVGLCNAWQVPLVLRDMQGYFTQWLICKQHETELDTESFAATSD